MALVKQFERKLSELWRDRIATVESLVKKRVGRKKNFDRARREKKIHELQELAEAILTKQRAKEELASLTAHKERRHHLRGRGWEERADNMRPWAKRLSGPVVYSFWRGKKCLYVGKGDKPSRLNGYAKSMYMKDADIVKARGIRGTSNLTWAECLSKHLYKPSHNKIKPAKAKWRKRCPVCRAKDEIKKELRSLFRLR